MKAPVITVKKLSTFQGHDGIGVNADIFIDGVYVGHFYDEARGGEPDFDFAYNDSDPSVRARAQAKFANLEAYAKDQPEIDLNADRKFDNKPMMHKAIAIDLIDYAINDAIEAREKKKANNRLNKDKMRTIMWGNPKDTSHYRYVQWKGHTLADIAARPNGVDILQSQVDRIKYDMPVGEEFLNADILTKLGVKL